MTSSAPDSAGTSAKDETDKSRDLPPDLRSRLATVEILQAVLYKNKVLDYALEDSAAYEQLGDRNKRLARMIVSTTLRRLGQIDDLIGRALDQDMPPRPARLHVLLRISTAQIIFMETPDYAAVDTAVSLAEALGLSKQKGLVNAVLRRIAREASDIVPAQDPASLNIPDWLMKIWQVDYGSEIARNIALASLSEAPLDITIKDPQKRQDWVDKLGGSLMPTGTVRLYDGGFVPGLPGFGEGAWWVQDMAAAIPALLFGDIAGKNVFDLCAAPGGKTAQLAAAGARVTAVDRSANRLVLLEKNIKRLNLEDRVRIVTADSSVWEPEEKADAVLLDAPCSATGTVRRHPDLLHLKSQKDIERLAAVQDRLVDHATALLKPGGVLVYCTCSLQKEEGERRIDAYLERTPAMSRKPAEADEVGGLSQIITETGDIRCLPFHLAARGGMDGFYAARLVKKRN